MNMLQTLLLQIEDEGWLDANGDSLLYVLIVILIILAIVYLVQRIR